MKENIIFKTVVGSRAYGTNIETSDTDYKGIYVQKSDDILSFRYKEQIDEGKDSCYYEIRRFLQLAQSANPTILEMLYMPENCMEVTSSAFELLVQHRDKFLTKKCLQSFGGYAVAQIRKAKGLDKKMNWESKRVERKTPFDFCFVEVQGKTLPLATWLKKEGKSQEHCGLVNLNHFRDCYALYYDHVAQYGAGNRNYPTLGFKGIASEDSNEVRLSSIPKEMNPEVIMYFNKDGYSSHCKDYREYTEWLENRNTARYVETKNHSQKIDGKNLMHCRRLLDMAMEIATEGTIKVLRPNRNHLLQIRRGEVSLDEIIEQAEKDLKNLDTLYENSNLPDSVDTDFVNDLLLRIRKMCN